LKTFQAFYRWQHSFQREMHLAEGPGKEYQLHPAEGPEKEYQLHPAKGLEKEYQLYPAEGPEKEYQQRDLRKHKDYQLHPSKGLEEDTKQNKDKKNFIKFEDLQQHSSQLQSDKHNEQTT